jgi:hypothetical protein
LIGDSIVKKAKGAWLMAIKKIVPDELLAGAEGKDVFGRDGRTDAECRDGPPSGAGS